jgi:lauroyl/myristoyl acyltransferase
MTLSSFLLSASFLESLPHKSMEELRTYILTKGKEWFNSCPEEAVVIKKNLQRFGIPHDNALVWEVQTHVLLHYYEKLLPLCLPSREFHRYLMERVAMPPELEALKAGCGRGAGVVLAVCHFGAVECIGPALAAHGLGLTGAFRFSTPQLSGAVRGRSAELAASGLFAPMNFIEIGIGQPPAALEMAAVLRRGGLLLAVFDEKTNYSVPVSLFKKQVWGGAGLDRLVRFAQAGAAVWSAFAKRNDDETYEVRLFEHSGGGPQLVQALYDNLEPLCAARCAQWYFLHEEIPFVI